MKKNWYRKMLISYFPIFLITVTILISLSFYLVNDITHNETVKADRITTGYAIDRLTRSLKGIELDVLEEVEKNTRYRQFLNTRLTEANSDILFDLANSIRRLAASDGLLDSIYLYRVEDRMVLTREGFIHLSSFADKQFIENALANPSFNNWSAVRPMLDTLVNKEKQVITMYKREPLPFGDEGLVIINVDMYAVERMLRSMNNDDLSFLNVRDATGELLFTTQSTKKLAGGKLPGKVFNEMNLELLNWTFESGTVSEQFFVWVSVISVVWLVIGFATVVIAILYMLHVTRKNYKPIRLMMNRIESLQLQSGAFEKTMDELSVIDQALEDLIDKTADYEKQRHENLLVSRRQLFHDLLFNEKTNDMNDKLRKLGVVGPEVTLSQLTFIIVEINHYDLFRSEFSPKDRRSLKFALTNVMQELAQMNGMIGWAEWIAESRMGIIVAASEREHYSLEGVREYVNHGGEWVNHHLRMSLLFGIGTLAANWSEIPQSAAAAHEALAHSLALGKQAIIMSTDIPAEAGLKWHKYIQLGSSVIREFRLVSSDWRQGLERIFNEMVVDCLSDVEIRQLLQTLLDMLQSEIGDQAERWGSLTAVNQMELLNDKIQNTESLEQLKQIYMDDLTGLYRAYVSYSESKNHHAMILEMRAYIEEQIVNPDLSLKHLSDRFHVSGKYASYLFKEAFDTKFVDFVVQLRMERAQQLLSETDDAIGDIALQVGYANAITLGRVFKRVVGVTPGEYRKLGLRPTGATTDNLI